jgi:two-component system, NarL family, nitrate/nitrite response regulator NarL
VHRTSSTSIVIVGQHSLLREGLAALLQHSAYKVIESVGHASDLKEVRVASDRQPLAILTIDETMGGPAEAAENIRTLRERFTRPTIVVVSETRNPVDVQKITALAANAYIANLTSRELLLKVLDLSAFAQPVLILSSSGTTASPSEPQAQPEPLAGRGGNGRGLTSAPDNAGNGEGPLFSQRERQILCQLARGNSNKEIARVFCITESTVKVHLKALLRKIGARNRTQVAIWAVDRGYPISSPSAQPPPTQRAEHSPRLDATDPPSQRVRSKLVANLRARAATR